MIARGVITHVKDFIKRYWPILRLRTIIFGTLLFVAALPGFGALFLRVYENTLLRQTEAELIAQGAAVTAMAEHIWPGSIPDTAAKPPAAALNWQTPAQVQAGYDRKYKGYYTLESTQIDLSATPILAPRPKAAAPNQAPDTQAMQVASDIAPVITALSRKTLASIQMLDQNGIVVAGYEQGNSLRGVAEYRQAMAGQAVTLLRQNGEYQPRYYFEFLSRASGLRLHHSRPIIVNGKIRGVLLLTRSPRQLFQGIYQDSGKILIGVAVIFILLVLLTAMIARAVIRPLESLSRATRAMTAGETAIPSRPGLAVVEIRDLYDDFYNMAQSITRRSLYLRDFAASVSHEFKTPLSGIRGAAELLEDHGRDMLEADRERFLSNITKDADRLSHLVQRLLEMAKADMQITDPDACSNAQDVILQIADGFRSDSFGIAINIGAVQDVAHYRVLAPASTIEAAAMTIFENSLQAGASHITVEVRAALGKIEIDFIDDGSGVAESDRLRIFDPFFTSKREGGGTGLGLAIARALTIASNGSLETQPSSQGLHLQMILPAAQ